MANGFGFKKRYRGSSLGQVQSRERLSEMEFYFPLQRLGADALGRLLSRHVGLAGMTEPPAHLERLRFEPLEGYMKGFIDLVFRCNNRFYIVDWKSNYLGASLEDYGAEGLRKAVADNFYNLQYTLYTLALHQYLRSRLADYSYASHFGEVFYVFLRGVDPLAGPAYGIYRDRPEEASIEALSTALIGG